MLFALVIAETAIQISVLATTAANAWEYGGVLIGLKAVFSEENWSILAPAAHLLLGFILISTSWVGWSRSIHRADSHDIEDIFSIPFVLLLIELLLVVLYFVLVRSVELDGQASRNDANTLQGISNSSAAPEAFWLTAVYIGYVVWDVFADGLPRYIPKDKRPYKQLPLVSSILVFISGFFTRCSVSLLCATAAWCVYHRANAIASAPLFAIWGDMALLCIVIWFWLAKIWERQIMENVFPWEQYRKGSRKHDTRGWRVVGSVGLIPVFIIFIILM
jgi:hypothetical protein